MADNPPPLPRRQDPFSTANHFHPLRSLTRLAVGGLLLGAEALIDQLDAWERSASAPPEANPPLESRASPVLPGDPVLTQDLPQSSLPVLPAAIRTAGSASAEASWTPAAIGLVFEAQDRLVRGLIHLQQANQFSSRWLQVHLRPIWRSRLLRPLRRRVDGLAAQGERITGQWIVRGQAEEAHSRRLAQIAFTKTVDSYIDYLTNNPEVQELVQNQSTGLANEVIEEVRERTVSADTFLEGLARSLLRRIPRRQLAGLPADIRLRAARLSSARLPKPVLDHSSGPPKKAP